MDCHARTFSVSGSCEATIPSRRFSGVVWHMVSCYAAVHRRGRSRFHHGASSLVTCGSVLRVGRDILQRRCLMPYGGNDWLALTQEPTLEPEIPICDAHHHFWDLRSERIPYQRYLLHELVADVNCGHNVRSTVFIEARAMYRPDGPVEMRPVGEVEWLMLDSRVVDVRMVRSNRTKVRKVS